MTRIARFVQDGELHIRAGLNGNYYAFSSNKDYIRILCIALGKSINSIYYREDHQCYAVRIRAEHMIKKIKEFMGS